MKKTNLIILIILAVIVLFGVGGCSAYNGMVEKQETATTALRLTPSTSARPLKRSLRQGPPSGR